MVTKHRDEVVELMGAIAHIQLLAVNQNAQRLAEQDHHRVSIS
jgi:hypothetical protein